MWGVGSWRETGKQNYGVSLPTRMVRICTGNMASLRKWFRGLTCGSRSCGGEEAGCGSQHGVTFMWCLAVSLLSERKICSQEKSDRKPRNAFDGKMNGEAITTVGRAR